MPGQLAPPILRVPGENGGPNPFGQFRLGGGNAAPAASASVGVAPDPASSSRQRALAMQQQTQNLNAAAASAAGVVPVPLSAGGANPHGAGGMMYPANVHAQSYNNMPQHHQQPVGATAASASSSMGLGAAGAVGGNQLQHHVANQPQSATATVLAATSTHGWKKFADGLRELLQQKEEFKSKLLSQVFFAASQSDLQSETDLLHKLEATVAQLQQAGPPAPIPVKIAAGSATPPFFWEPSTDYESEFQVSGEFGEAVTKVRDFEDRGWVIPVAGSLRMSRGGVYRWSLHITRKCQHRPQMQFGIHGESHEKPWRLVTTSRCSRSRDDDPWQDRPAGDRLIDEGDFVHVVVDLRGWPERKFGSFKYAVNDGAFETAFEDLPLDQIMMPVVSMGGDSCCVQLCASETPTN